MANEQNLIPAKKGEVRNPKGKPKGTRSLSTIIRQLMENPPDWKLVPIKDAQAQAKKYKNKSAWEAIVYVAMSKAMAGDTKAMAWLSRSGYGDKLTHDLEPGFFSTNKLEINIVNPEPIADSQPETESSADATERPTSS